jgi:hypothetical protein
MSYKNWDFALNGYGAFGFKVYNGKKAQRNGGENVEASVANNSGHLTIQMLQIQ